MDRMRLNLALSAAVLLAAAWARADAPVFDVRAHGAVGDGKTLDTEALNTAVEACAKAGGGQVVVPPGTYLTGTVRLQSNVTLVLADGAVLAGTPDLNQYRSFAPPESKPGATNHWHRALILGEGVENVAIVGRGVIDGRKVFDPDGEEHMRGPHGLLLGNSRNVTIRDVTIRDAANYAVLLELTSQVEVRGIKVAGGWDGVHFRGRKDRPCRDVSITDCEFYTGDDCIAGGYWERTLIDRCVINSSCNGIRLIGPAKDLIVHGCLFFGPGRFEHRTSREKHRTNMLAGLCLQPGAWMATEGVLDEVKVSDLTMHDVTTPLHLSLKPGNTCGRVWISRVNATGISLAAASIESWAETPIERVCLRDISFEFAGGGSDPGPARPQVRAPGVDARSLPSWGLYARNVQTLQLENVRLAVEKPAGRPAVMAEHVGTIELDHFQIPHGEGPPMILDDVREVRAVPKD
jgi:hypothetical protein